MRWRATALALACASAAAVPSVIPQATIDTALQLRGQALGDTTGCGTLSNQ